MKNSRSRQLAKLIYIIEYQLFGHILNPLWKSRGERRHTRFEIKNRATRRYLSQFDDVLRDMLPPIPADSSEEPTRVFTIWFQGEQNAPNSVKACFASMRRHLGYEVIVLDKDSLHQWISLPDNIIKKWKEGKIGMAHFSDICRVELLFQHGGLWFDATDYVTGPVHDYIMQADFFVFMAGDNVGGWYGFIQNCFIRAKKGDPLLGLWRNAILEYWRLDDEVMCYYTHQILFQHLTQINMDAKQLFDLMPKVKQDPTHELWYHHKDDAYDEDLFRKLTSLSFFHKFDFKNESARNPVPGSFAAFMFRQNDSF